MRMSRREIKDEHKETAKVIPASRRVCAECACSGSSARVNSKVRSAEYW